MVSEKTKRKPASTQLAEKKPKSKWGGPRPNAGGPRPGSGRPRGVPNKVTQELGEAARAYTADALATLHHICMHSEIDAARVSAACALLDRGHGKPKQQIEAKLDGSEAFLRCWQAISNGTA